MSYNHDFNLRYELKMVGENYMKKCYNCNKEIKVKGRWRYCSQECKKKMRKGIADYKL